MSRSMVAPGFMEEHIKNEYDRSGMFTKRQYLVHRAVIDGSNIWMAIEAVSSVAIEHPEWDMEEEKTWEEWEA